MKFLWYGFALLLVGLDQLTKHQAVEHLPYGVDVDVLPFLSWKLLYNTGAAFSMFAEGSGWQRWTFSLVAVAFSLFLVNEIRKLGRDERWYGFAYGCILAGALGNMIDRASLGYVIDFVFVNYDWFRFPIFNVADSAVSLGAAVWIMLLAIETWQARRRA